jgi:hypothetical protein
LEPVLVRQATGFAVNCLAANLQRDDTIDFSRPFMPEELTPLYHTRGFARLDARQKLRYNQLHGLYFNEQTIFFEKALARNVLGYFLNRGLPAELKAGLQQFLVEEEQHTEMFRCLNRECAPEIYSHRDFFFITVPPAAASALDFVSRRPEWFPFLLWLMHLQEERALFFGQTFLKQADALEPHFVAAQRKHVADEVGHVRWDDALLDWIWPRTGFLRRQINIRILAWMIEEYFSTPKRAAVQVLWELVKEFPELRTGFSELRRELVELGHDKDFRKSLYCQENVPNTFRRFNAWPEFQPLKTVMPGYVPAAEP